MHPSAPLRFFPLSSAAGLLPGLVLLSGLLLAAGCVSAEEWVTAELPGEPEPAGDQGEDDGDDSPEEVSDEPDEVEEEDDSTEEDEDDSNEGQGEDEPEPEPEPGFELIAGTWVVIESELTQDGCNLNEQVDRGQPGSLMELLPTAQDSFDLTFASDGEVTHCAMEDELQFDCLPSSSTDNRAADFGLDAVVVADRESSGSFDSSEALVLVSSVFLECQGPDCGWVNILLGSNFPCSMVMSSDFAPAQR